MHGEDLSIFFDADEHADVFTITRLTAPGNTVIGILGTQSKEGLQGQAIGARRELRYPAGSPVLVDGDELVLGGTHYKVRGTPEQQNDGAELVAVLTEVRT